MRQRDQPIDFGSQSIWIAILVAALCILMAWLQWGRSLGWDEFEFVRATQWVREGRVPYRDFWEHHAPLQWYLLAPMKGLFNRPGVSTVLWMRWCQLPFWILAGCCAHKLIMRAKAPAWVGFAVCTLPLLSPVFTLWAVEYRPDTLGTALLLLGLWSWRTSRTRLQAVAAGAALALCPLVNLRLGSLAVFTFILCFLTRPAGRRWGLHPRWRWLVLGGAIPVLLGGAQLITTGSAQLAYRRLVQDNAWFNGTFQVASQNSIWLLPFREFDVAGMVLVLAGFAATLHGLIGLRRPSLPTTLALIQLAQVVSISALSVRYPYHLQGFLLLASLQGGVWLVRHSRFSGDFVGSSRLRISAAFAMAALLGYATVHLTLANSRRTLVFQNALMHQLEAGLQPGDRVLDGVGFALRHEPAYACWFLPTLARALAQHGRLPAYPPEEFLSHPPGAIVYSGRLHAWLGEWPDLQGTVTRHFLPVNPFLMKPGLSARLQPGAANAQWTAPQTGRYRIHASTFLAGHPWFNAPIRFFSLRGASNALLQINASAPLSPAPATLDWRVNGALRPSDGCWLSLNQGDLLRVDSSGPAPIGIFLIPESVPQTFQGCQPGDTPDSNLHGIWAWP